MFSFQIYVCWQTENKNMSRLSVRHCSRLFKLSFKNCQAAERRNKLLLMIPWKSVGQKSRALMILELEPENTNTKSEETGGGQPKVLR